MIEDFVEASVDFNEHVAVILDLLFAKHQNENVDVPVCL